MMKMLVLLLALSFVLTQPAQSALFIETGGGTFPAQVYSSWMYAYSYVDSSAIFSYAAVGSGAGVNGLESGIYSLAASDSASQVARITPFGDGQLLPMLAGAIVPVVNLNMTTASPVILDRITLTKIFLGVITQWNDTEIQNTNPNITMPYLPITLVVRSDSSGSSDIFTAALDSFGGGIWSTSALGTTPVWPAPVVPQYESAGVAIAVRETPGAIGYCGLSYANQYGVPYALMINKAGSVVSPTVASVVSAIKEFGTQFSGNFSAVIVDGAQPASWPISGYTYIVFRRTSLPDCQVALYLIQFLRWASTDANAISIAEQYGFVPIVNFPSVNTTDRLWATINSMECDNQYIGLQLYTYQKAYFGLAGIFMGAICTLMFLTWWYQKGLMMSWLLLEVVLFGALLLMSSVYTWDSVPSLASCQLQIWFTTLGTTLLFGYNFARSTRPWRLLKVVPVDNFNQREILVVVSLLLVIDIIVCIVWSAAGGVAVSGVETCTGSSFWGFFGFFLIYKYLLVLVSLLVAVLDPQKKNTYGENLYLNLSSASLIVLGALFLPVILLISNTANNVVRQIFSPSVFIMTSVIVFVLILAIHKVRNVINILASREDDVQLVNQTDLVALLADPVKALFYHHILFEMEMTRVLQFFEAINKYRQLENNADRVRFAAVAKKVFNDLIDEAHMAKITENAKTGNKNLFDDVQQELEGYLRQALEDFHH